VFFVQSYSSGRFDVLLMLARLLRVPMIAYHAGGRPEGHLGRRARQWTIPRVDRLIVSGHDEQEVLVERFGVSRDRLSVILTPIDVMAFQPRERTAACKAAGLDIGRRYLLFVGRLNDEVKRISAIIRTFADLQAAHPDVDLLIAGDGPDGAKLRSQAARYAPDRVRFLGWVSGAQAQAPLYSAAECLVLPSWREGFPTVVGEAMACGTPVLASEVGGVGELVIDGETGWLVAPGDDEALRTSLAFVLSHPDAVRSMRSRVRAQAEARVAPGVVGAALRECFALACG
jgi:glycosyltransferase involved in cell wall biosynthesis